MRTLTILAACLAMVALLVAPVLADEGVPRSVYRAVVDDAEGDFDVLFEALVTQAESRGWQVLASVDAGTPDDCDFRARVLAIFDPEYAAAVYQARPGTGAFAVVDRINLYTDEQGTHASFVNPLCLNRTVLMEDTAHNDLAEKQVEKLTGMIRAAVPGTAVERDYGQVRTEGKIGKTMGVVAGGDFGDLIVDQAKAQDLDVPAMAALVRKSLTDPTKKWGLHVVFDVAIPEADIIVLGVTGTPMDSKSFKIVGAGGDENRKDFACPGLAHAAAYPIELVVMRDGDDVVVRTVDPMFRMKMYFEDAGKWAFMNNMRMPGSIEKELRKAIKKGLEAT